MTSPCFKGLEPYHGACLTLYQQLQDDLTKDPPTSTEIVIDGNKVVVIYRQ